MQKELTELTQKQESIINKAKEISIVSTETLQVAVSITAEIKDVKKRVEEIRKFFVNPLNNQVKEINLKFKPFTDILDKTEAEVKSKMTEYQAEQEKICYAEEERIRKLQQKEYEKQIKKAEKKGDDIPPPPPPIKLETEKVEGLQMRKIWVAEIEDIKLIPEIVLYDLINTEDGQEVLNSYLNKLAKAGVRTIAGVRIYEKSIPVIK